MYHKNLHVSVEKPQMLTLKNLEEISLMSGLFYVVFLSLLMTYSIISCTINMMLHRVIGSLIQAATFMCRNLSPQKECIFGRINISKCASEYLFSFLMFSLKFIGMFGPRGKIHFGLSND